MDGNTIKERLRARRKAMNLTTQSEVKSDAIGTSDTVMIMDTNDVDDTASDDGTALKSILESRREASRRKLASQDAVVAMEMDELDRTLGDELPPSPPPSIPTPSRGPPDPTSPRADSRSSTPFGRSTPSSHSMLRSRLQAKMNKRSGGATEDAKPRSRRLRDRMNMSTRFDETVKQYTTLEEAQLLERIESKLSWKRTAEKAQKLTGEASSVDSFDFFTKQYEDVVDSDDKTERVPESVEAAREGGEVEGTAGDGAQELAREGVEESGTAQESTDIVTETQQEDNEAAIENEEMKLLVSDIVSKDLDWKLYHMLAAEYRGYNHQLEQESTKYFIPSSLPLEAANKVEEHGQPRYLEDEGFYVGEKPIVLQQNKNILESRLLKHGGSDWFGPDGQVDLLPNPVTEAPTKPWVDSVDELDPCIETTYVKARGTAVEDKYFPGSDENELQIDIGTIIFQHHPLMSREHVLVSDITKMYDEYRIIRHKNYITFYTDKLAALRNAAATLKETLDETTMTEDVFSAQRTHINDFTAEIRRTTQQLASAESAERDMMRRIIEVWGGIKSIREKQGYNNTSVKLVVKREEVNYQQDVHHWELEVENQVNERKEEYDVTITIAHQEEVRKYQVQLQEWKQNRLKLKRIRKKMQRGSQENLLDPNSEVEEEELNIAGNIDKPQKPDKPAPFDKDAVRNDVMNQLLANRRNPGEAKISLELTHTANITPISSVPALESSRRRAMQKSTMNLRVLFNGREVFFTDPKTLTSDFKLNFGSIFRVRIAQWPESLKVELLSSGLVTRTLISSIFLTIPPTTVHSGNVRLGPTEFLSTRVESFNHEGVGSNTPFTLRPNDASPTSINTKGVIISSVSWSLDQDGRVLAPKGFVERDDPISGGNPLKINDPVIAIGAEGLQDPESLTKWVKESRLDPNDPENAALVPFMQGIKDGEGFPFAQDYFRLEQLQEQFNFLTDEEFSHLNRLRLLQLRDKEVAEFRNISMIPCNEHEITESAFTTYERRLKEKDSLQSIDTKGLEGGALSAHRVEVLRFRQKVKDAVLHRFYTSRHHHTLQDMVHEEQIPDIGTLGSSMAKIVEPRRPLKPIRKTRKKATSQNLNEGSVKILINVVRGYNIPTRQSAHAHQQNRRGAVQISSGLFTGSSLMAGQTLEPGSKSFLVSPFVAASFQDTVVTTSVAQGPNPSWNEELQLPFSAPNNDYSSSNLQKVDDVLFIHLFDRVTEDATPADTEDPTTIVTRLQNYWLGSFKLPFSTVYQRGKIDGTFKIKVPPVLLGYDLERQLPANADMHERMESQFMQQSSGTFLTIFVTLEPVLKPMDPPRLSFESQEDPELLAKCAVFMADCNKRYPTRNVKTTVIDIKGESVLITRFIRALPPPPDLIEGLNPGSKEATEKLARFVSLIPFVSDNVTYAGICDLWSTCDQFMQMLCGDEEEHAILLLNFFLHLGKQAYLVLGAAVPEGNTAYVLTLDQAARDYTIWNASTGQQYVKGDPHTPLQSVGALVNDKNIWFNVQRQAMPIRMHFDVTRPADWKPFFGATATPLPSIQPESIYFPPTDQSYVSNLVDVIERTLKDRIVSWRPRHITRWNRSGNSILRQIAKGLEESITKNDGKGGASEHNTQILSQLGDVRFTGYPMDQPFTNVESIVSAVRSTEVHKIQDPDVEFSMAVHIHAYPSSVLAVWVYVAAIVNTRRHSL